MKAVLLDGSRQGESSAQTIRPIITAELAARDWSLTPFTLRELEIHHCQGCFGCWVQTPGQCLVDDAAREIAATVINSDLVIYLTPVTFGGYSSELKKALDRMICLVSPFFTRVEGEIHHKPRYERFPRLLGIGVTEQVERESEQIFKTLVRRNALNMHTPAHAAGVIHLEQEPEAIRAQVQALFQAVEGG